MLQGIWKGEVEGNLTKGSFCPWFPNAIESAVVSVIVTERVSIRWRIKIKITWNTGKSFSGKYSELFGKRLGKNG